MTRVGQINGQLLKGISKNYKFLNKSIYLIF